MSDIEEFELTDYDFYAISIAIDCARLLLRHSTVTPRQVIGIGNALYALERLPLTTPGVDSKFGLVLRGGTEDFNEIRYIFFVVTEDCFEITRGGSTYDKAVGGESYSEPCWLVRVDGYRDESCDLYDLEDSIEEYLNLEAAISVTDQSVIEYEDDDDDSYGEGAELSNEHEQEDEDSDPEPTPSSLECDLVNIIISRQDVESKNILPTITALSKFIASPQVARAYMEKLDIGFSGYDQDNRELFEIPEVRDHVYLLDEKFPFWLFFLAKNCLGLQCLMFCFLSPHLTDIAKAKLHPRQLQELLTKRWFPAMNQISKFAELDEEEIEELTDRTLEYLVKGPLKNR